MIFGAVQSQQDPNGNSGDSKVFWTTGSSYNLISGIASTRSDCNGHPSDFFSERTVILGKQKPTKVSWKIQIEQKYIQRFNKGYLVIACIREFGGLHSERKGAGVSILINNIPVDKFQLLVMPQRHSDYFHINRNSKPSNLEHLSTHSTIYAWPIRNGSLLNTPEQTVTVSIEKDVYWDIDDVAIQCYIK